MDQYNKKEKKIANSLSRFPFIKRTIKKLYQFFNWIIYKKDYKYKCAKQIECIYPNEKVETFFGYYDKSPLNETGEMIICHVVEKIATNKKPNPEKNIKICLLNFHTKKIIKTFECYAYNWQQGARLMWINKNEFIFNDYNKEMKRYYSHIYNVTNDTIKDLNWPIYDVFDTTAYTLNFSRLNKYSPDYGYKNIAFSEKKNDLLEDGIFKINIETNKIELLISIKEILHINKISKNENAQHYVNHIMISPDGNYFIFLHRWLLNKIKHDALMLSNSEGTKLECLLNEGIVSHCYWKDSSNIIAYLTGYNGNNYYNINIETKKMTVIDKNQLEKFGDGHPIIYDNIMIFDTYPNKARMKELYMYNTDNSKLIKIGEFYEP